MLIIGERAKRARHSLGVLNANLRYMYIYIYVEVCLSPLSVAWEPHYVKEAELDHSHFLGGIRNVGVVKYLPSNTARALKMFKMEACALVTV